MNIFLLRTDYYYARACLGDELEREIVHFDRGGDYMLSVEHVTVTQFQAMDQTQFSKTTSLLDYLDSLALQAV